MEKVRRRGGRSEATGRVTDGAKDDDARGRAEELRETNEAAAPVPFSQRPRRGSPVVRRSDPACREFAGWHAALTRRSELSKAV